MSAGVTRRALLGGALGGVLSGAALAAPPLRAPAPRLRPGLARGPALAAARGFSGRVGFLLRDARSGETLEALEAARGFAPASVAKLATALYALETLGPQHRFETQVLTRGPIRDGVLEGDLVLRGGGDPELDSAALAALAVAAARRLRAVSGRFIVEGAAIAAMIDDDQPPDAAYNPAIGALNLNFNRVRLAWSRRAGGVDAGLSAHSEALSPPAAALDLVLEAADCGCPAFSHDASGAREAWRVRADALRGDGAVFLPVRRPAAYAAALFRDAAAEAGLPLPAPQGASGPPAADASVLAGHAGRALDAVAADMLRHSTNLTAEALGLAASRAGGAGAGSLAASAAAMSDWAAARAGRDGFALRDHSGLSARSRMSPEATVALLRAPGATAALSGLARPYRLDGMAETAVIAKTGTLDFARGLAGWLRAPSGRALVFAIFANDLERRAATRGGPAPGKRAWRAAAMRLERALLASWAARFG